MRSSAREPRWARVVVEVPPVVLALGIAALFAETVAGRIGYPFDLEWMEGGMLVHAWRVLHGLPLYVKPSSDFIPFIYPPLYVWTVAAVGKVFGLGYAAGRAVSVAGTVAAALALVAAVRLEPERGRGRWAMAIGAAGLFLSTYDEGGAFLDLVRNDGLLIGLLSWALVAVRHRWLRTGGLLLALAFATKHNAAVLGLPAFIWLWRVHGRRDALRFLAWSAGPALVFLGAMQFEGDGLFLTYILGVPAVHPMVVERLFPGAERELFEALRWAIGGSAIAGVVLAATRRPRITPGGAYWLVQGAFLVIVAAVMRGHHGGFLNVLIPGTWALALLAGLGFDAVVRRWPRIWVRAGVGALVAWQIWVGRWDPAQFAPTADDRSAGTKLIELLRDIDGPVLAPQFPWYPVKAGKKPGFHLVALWDIDHRHGPLRKYVKDVEADVAAQKWAAVVMSAKPLRYGFEKYYRRSTTLAPPRRSPKPKTGWPVRARYLWVRRSLASTGGGSARP